MKCRSKFQETTPSSTGFHQSPVAANLPNRFDLTGPDPLEKTKEEQKAYRKEAVQQNLERLFTEE